MNQKKLKSFVVVALACISCLTAAGGSRAAGIGSRDSREKPPLPSREMIDRFDGAIQARFLKIPSFGFSRIVSRPLHLGDHFEPLNQEEKDAVGQFRDERWKVGIYLFGRTGILQTGKVNDFKVQYKLNPPVPVTGFTHSGDLVEPEKLTEQVGKAFETLSQGQTVGTVLQGLERYEFTVGKRAYVATAVRARESCLKCHQTQLTSRTESTPEGEKRYFYRPCRVGDTIGVLVYSFERK